MLPLSVSPANEIRSFVRHWMKLLAEGRLHEACRLLDEPNSYGLVWTPERLMTVLRDNLGEGTRFGIHHPEGPQFTDPDELPDQAHEVGILEGDKGYWFDYDLPLNHERSDLTAQFEFLKKPHGYAVVLHEFHVW